MNDQNRALVERLLPTRAERSIARLYPEILDRLLNAARAESEGAISLCLELARHADDLTPDQERRVLALAEAWQRGAINDQDRQWAQETARALSTKESGR